MKKSYLKKVIGILLCVILIIGLNISALTVSATAVSGKIGSCKWSLDGTVLTVYGNGGMDDGGDFSDASPWGTDITEVIIENGVTNINDFAFEFCKSLTSVKMPATVTHIGVCAFQGCTAIKSITVPKSVTHIGDGAFCGCKKLGKITIPKSVKVIGSGAFSGCALESIKIPESITKIADDTFSNCHFLTNVIVPENVTNIGSDAFSGCNNLASITINGSLESIEDGAFCDCANLTDIKMLSTVKSIGDNAFYHCQCLREIEIAEGVVSIGENAFAGCVNLTRITIPGALKSVGNKAFLQCSSINYVNYTASCTKRKDIKIGDDNLYFSYAKWVYKSHLKDSKNTTILKKATVSEDGLFSAKCPCCQTVAKAKIYKASYIKLSTAAYTYNKKARKPKVIVKDSKGNLLENGTDYTVKYPAGRTKIGTYTVKVTLKGSYGGNKYLKFKIIPKSTVISKLTAAPKCLKVSYKKQTLGTAGYQIKYSTSKKFTSYKIKTVNKNKTTTCTLKALKSKKTYYVSIRTYKVSNGKKYYSAWSGYKYKKTK